MKAEAIEAFLDELLKKPDEVMQAIQLRLAHTDFELKLLKADPLRIYEKSWEQPAFPIRTGERNMPGLW